MNKAQKIALNISLNISVIDAFVFFFSPLMRRLKSL